MSDISLSVAYIRPKSRTERPRKTKIGTEVAHVTHDSDTTFKIKRSRSQPLEKYSIVNYRKNTLGFSLEYTLVILLQ